MLPFELFPFGLVEILGQKLEAQDLAVVALLVVLEGVLSIDNALVLGLLAKRLPPHQRARALTYGLVGAFVFRILAIGTATFLLRWTFVKFLGGAYLVYIAARHLFFESKEEDHEKIDLDAQGNPILVDEETGGPVSDEQEETEIRERVPAYVKPETRKKIGAAKFWPTVFVIEMTDIAFAVDSILAAIALVGRPPPGTPADAIHPKLWVVVTGGIIGVVLMRFAAAVFIKLLEKFPRFEMSAYLLVIIIGMKLLLDWGFNTDWSFGHPLPGEAVAVAADQEPPAEWKKPFASFEQTRRNWVHGYESWLHENWIFKIEPHAEHPAPAAGEEENAVEAMQHIPHLLDFHDLRRPECMSFWLLMLVCFLIGFIPEKKKA